MGQNSVEEGQLLWTPQPAFAQASNVAKFIDWLRDQRGRSFADYAALWRWSVDDIEAEIGREGAVGFGDGSDLR